MPRDPNAEPGTARPPSRPPRPPDPSSEPRGYAVDGAGIIRPHRSSVDKVSANAGQGVAGAGETAGIEVSGRRSWMLAVGSSPMRSIGEVAAKLTKGVATRTGACGHPIRRLRRHLPHGFAVGKGLTAGFGASGHPIRRHFFALCPSEPDRLVRPTAGAPPSPRCAWGRRRLRDRGLSFRCGAGCSGWGRGRSFRRRRRRPWGPCRRNPCW